MFKKERVKIQAGLYCTRETNVAITGEECVVQIRFSLRDGRNKQIFVY